MLDLGVGFFVWAGHLLAIYIATTIACQLGLRTASSVMRAAFPATLVGVTGVALAVVAWHAARRYRGLRDTLDDRFRRSITVGGDAIAAVAIGWQLLAVILVPPCV